MSVVAMVTCCSCYVTLCGNYDGILITEVTLATEGSLQAKYGDSRRIIRCQK
jgi:hypothetical protein